jgi:hypothetical protein
MLRNVNTSEKKDNKPMVRSSSTFNDYFSYVTNGSCAEGTFLELTDSYKYAPDRAAMATCNTLFDKKENIRNQLDGHHYYFLQNKIWILRLVVLLVFFHLAEGLDPLTDTGVQAAVNNWIAGGSLQTGVITKYGNIEDWDMSGVTSLYRLFESKRTFNADLSKWDVSSVTSLYQSTLQSHDNIFDSFCVQKQLFFLLYI